MGLATSCPACGTVFRVVEDQLQASEGWVRCGQCAEVFNALQSLFDLDRPPPADAFTVPPAGDSGSVYLPPRGVDDAHTPALDSSLSVDVWAATEPARAPLPEMPPLDAEVQLLPEPVAPAALTPAADAATAPEPVAPAFSSEPAVSVDFPDLPPLLEPRAAVLSDDEVAAPHVPSFVVQAQQAEKWQRPAVQVGLVAAAAVLVVTLAGQGLWRYRDVVAARWPVLTGPLSGACDWVGCTLAPPRLPEALQVENTTVSRTPGVDAYRLQVTLSNRAPFEVQAPHLALTLSDAQGADRVRRVLAPADFRQAGALAPGEHTWQLDFGIAERAPAGYTVTAFYP